MQYRAMTLTLTVPLFTQVYKWFVVNCQDNLTKCWKITLRRLTSHPEGVAIVLVMLHLRGNRHASRKTRRDCQQLLASTVTYKTNCILDTAVEFTNLVSFGSTVFVFSAASLFCSSFAWSLLRLWPLSEGGSNSSKVSTLSSSESLPCWQMRKTSHIFLCIVSTKMNYSVRSALR